MELTLANVWPGAGVNVGGRTFRILSERTPSMWLTSPRGIKLHATVCSSRDIDGVHLPNPGRFKRCRRDHGPYSVAGLDIWGYAFSVPDNGPFLLALWLAPHGLEPRDMAQTYAISEVQAVLADGGDHEAAAFQAALGHAVGVNWDLRPYPPFQHYVVGGGWRQLKGYWAYQAELNREN